MKHSNKPHRKKAREHCNQKSGGETNEAIKRSTKYHNERRVENCPGLGQLSVEKSILSKGSWLKKKAIPKQQTTNQI